MSTKIRRLSLPTSVLPKLSRSLTTSDISTTKLLELIHHLRLLYATPADSSFAHPNDEAVGSSAYASEVEEDETVDPLHQHDAFERTWAINWLGLVVKRGEEWVAQASEDDEEERDLRATIVDEAAALVSHLTATSESGSILRPLLLPTCLPDAERQTEPLLITLNDALPSSLDPTSVGLQSWGASIILARMIALEPAAFGVSVPNQRVLELGAGTGLLSLVWKGMSERLNAHCEVFATDYHDGVLENLQRNVISNSAAITPVASPTASPPLAPSDPKVRSTSSSHPGSGTGTPLLPVQTHKLDWSAVHSSRQFSAASNPRNPIPTIMPPPFDKPFHTLLAADVVYGPTHALWLKSCVEQFLVKPDEATEVLESQAKLPAEMANLSLGDSTLSLPAAPPVPQSTDAPADEAGPESAVPTHVARTSQTSSRRTGSASAPAFHLIVPLRPTHAEAIASIKDVFPKKENLPERTDGDAWRVAVESVTEVERVKGVGRSDEENYRLYRIGWC
ncbi:hypothetical protein JCM1841_002376 [Sporobolomyces salmonicolor]